MDHVAYRIGTPESKDDILPFLRQEQAHFAVSGTGLATETNSSCMIQVLGQTGKGPRPLHSSYACLIIATTVVADEEAAPLNLQSTSHANFSEFGMPGDCSQGPTAAGQCSRHTPLVVMWASLASAAIQP